MTASLKKETSLKGKKASKSESRKESAEKKGAKSEMAYRFLAEPLVTEKSHEAMAANKYVFKVLPEATKQQVKQAIEELYGVNVIKMNMVSLPSKKRVTGRTVGRKSGVKKAIATLKEGDKIELFQGV